MLSAALQHGDAILRRLPPGGRFVELGVAAGELSQYIADHAERADLVMVDTWRYYGQKHPYHQQSALVGDPNGVRTQRQVESDHTHALRVAENTRARVLRMDTMEAACHVDDASADLVFIDADHRYSAALADCRVWLPKVKPGGYLGGHDYGRFRDGGVTGAVTQFIEETGLTLELDEGWTWFVRIGGAA